MHRARRLLLFLAIAFAVALGQHAAVLHAVQHAKEDLAAGSTQSSQECESHSLFASLGSGAGSDPPASKLVVDVAPMQAAPLPRFASLAPRYSFLSRAPPAAPV